MVKRREYVKRIVITLKDKMLWEARFLEGSQVSDVSESFISVKDLKVAVRAMKLSHRLYQREKLMEARRVKDVKVAKKVNDVSDANKESETLNVQA